MGHICRAVFAEYDLCGQGREHLPQNPVRAVALAGLAQGTEEIHLKRIGLGVLGTKVFCGPLGTDGV